MSRVDTNDLQDKQSLRTAVSNISHFGGATRTGRALDKALTLFSEEFGARVGRQDVAQVAVVVSDGRSIDDPKPAADKLRTAGVTVMTLGIGDYVFMPELEKISGKPELSFKNDSIAEFFTAFKKIAIGEYCDYAKGESVLLIQAGR